MTIDKKTFYISIAILAFSFIGIFCIEKACKSYDICVGLFTGAFVTLVLSLMHYFHKKEQLLNTIYEKCIGIYFCLVNIRKLTYNFLVQRKISDQSFKQITSLVNFTRSTFLPNKEIELFDYFIPCELKSIISNFATYIRKLYNLQSITTDINTDILKYALNEKDVSILKSQKKLDLENEESQKEQQFCLRDCILMRAAKLHEYQKSLEIELDNLLTKLSEKYKFKTGWTTAKRLNEDVFRDYWQ